MFSNQFGTFNGGGLGLSLDTGLGNFGTQQSPSLQNYDFGLPSMNPSFTQAQSQAGNQTIEIRKLYLGLTRPQRDQWRRSYDVLVTGHEIGCIQEKVEQYGLDTFRPDAIGGMLSEGLNFIKHAGTPEAQVGIDNGWEVERFRFTMVVDVYRNGKFNRTEFISGYTDSASVMNAGLISTVTVDPNMVFTINHVTEARMRNVDNHGQPIPMVSRTHAVVRNPGFGGIGQMTNDNLYMTRPSDILRAVDKVQVYNGMQEAMSFGDFTGGTYQDLDSTLTGMPMCSNDTNLLLPTFASRTLKGLYESSVSQIDPINMDNVGSGSMAANRVQDTPFSTCGFVHVMNRLLANGVGTTAQFTFADLLRLDRTIDDRTEVFGRSYESGAISIPDGRSVETIGSAHTISIHATSIAQTTLSLMAMAGVATLAYNANNRRTGDIEVTIQACDGMDYDGMLFQRLEVLKSRLVMECLSMVGSSNGNYVPFEVDVFSDSFNDVFIQLSWDNEHRDYLVPAFASSAMTPVVTKDMNKLIGMAEAINDVVTHCKPLLNPSAHSTDVHDIWAAGNGETRVGGLAGEY